MSELPSGWFTAELGQLCTRIVDGSHNPPKGVPQGRPMLSARNVAQRQINFNGFRFITESAFAIEHARTRVSAGDVLLTIVGAIGRTAVVPADLAPFALQRSVVVLRPALGVESKYLAYSLEAPAVQDFLGENAKGTAQKGIYLKALSKVEIPLAPSKEQQRIADKLDALLARVDACRERLDRVPAILKRFREAVLEAAVSGRLTEEWRESRARSRDEWSSTTVGALLTAVQAGLNVQCEERPPNKGEKGLVKISAVTWGTFDDEESKTLPKGRDVPESTRIQVGDFLISRANTLELVGACVIVKKVTRPVYLSDKVLRLVVEDHVKPWLLISLQSRTGRAQIEALASGNQLSMRNLSQANLRSIELVMPPPDERDEIVRRVDELFALADGLEREYGEAVARVEKLTPAVLAKAFRGELVPQDPEDEPASVLLERIRAERESVGSTARGSRTRARARATVKRVTRRAKR